MRRLALGFCLVLVFFSSAAQGGGLGGASSFTGLSDAPHVYAGQSGNCTVVKTDETGLQFGPCASGGGTPGGSNTQVQFNDSSTLGGDSGLVYNKTTNALTADSVIAGGLLANKLTLAGSTTTTPVTLTASGSDTDVSILLAPKGAGLTRSTKSFFFGDAATYGGYVGDLPSPFNGPTVAHQ